MNRESCFDHEPHYGKTETRKVKKALRTCACPNCNKPNCLTEREVSLGFECKECASEYEYAD